MKPGTAPYARLDSMRAWLLFLIGVVAGSWSCGPSQSRASGPAASHVSSESLFGQPANVSLIFRPTQMARDPIAGLAFARAMQESDPAEAELLDALLGASQIEVLLGVRDWSFTRAEKREKLAYAVIIRGLSGDARARLASKAAKRALGASARTPSGVVELTVAEGSSLFPSAVFVMPDETWVVVDPRTAPRARAHYASENTAPPPADLEPELIAAVFADRAALDAMASLIETKGGSARLRQVWPRLNSAGLAVAAGSPRGVDLFLDHASDAEAEQTTRALGAELERARIDQQGACPAALHQWCKTTLEQMRITQRGARVVIGLRY
jgi:hypothetical protein